MAQTENSYETTASTDHRTSWSSLRKFFRRDESSATSHATVPEDDSQRPAIARRLSKKVVPGLPRPGTFKRQQSELRDRLEPIKTNHDERRTLSVDRRRAVPARDGSLVVAGSPRLSAPELKETKDTIDTLISPLLAPTASTHEESQGFVQVSKVPSNLEIQSVSTEAFNEMILEELERRWILNLSMHFRDKSKREKFFVTYAETPTHWRRVTISMDYRTAPNGSLEEELQKTRFQRDKSARIYESIRESLPDIQFYDTVTNLKLQTENERLHVHVVEDLSEIIPYPPARAISHLNCRRVREEEIVFDSHLSGFVYKVRVNDQIFIKKEIPGPDTVDEFLYEINALHRLSGSRSVIQFGGVVLDNECKHVKGLLISFAEKGALIDVIYDGDGQISWVRRERWAKHIVQGLSEIHEAGFVQGDFTLSNIVIDGDDNAKIIDINRRGCPVGWEPPEVAALIESSQRISMYIGVKSDLFQLGMVLFALARQHDEPETLRPLSLDSLPGEVPGYFLDICRRCLDDDPRQRSQAQVLLGLFPELEENHQAYHNLLPIVVDAIHVDDEPFLHDTPHLSHAGMLSPALNPDSRSPGLGLCNYAPTELTEESDYFPRRGRSPPAPQSTLPSDIPLPGSSLGSNYLDSPTQNTATENEAIVSTLASQDEHQHHQTEKIGPQHMTASQMARTTAASEAPIASFTADLTGVGSAYTTNHFEFPKGNIDDEFTTEPLHNDSAVHDHSISCDLAGG